MPRFFRPFKKPFSELSRHKQRDLYIRLRGQIKNHKKKYSEHFLSRHVLDEPNRPALFDQDADFYFLGLDGHTIWNAFLSSANHEYWRLIDELASQKSEELLPSPDYNIKDMFIPIYDASGRLAHYTMRENEPQTHPEFGGKTRSKFESDYAQKLIREDTGNIIPIYEEFRIEPGFKYGVGLYITIDAPTINIEVFETAIARFRALGEKPWKSSTPVPHAHLPKDTFANLAAEFKTPPTQEEVNTLVKEAQDEIQAEKDAGTYVEPQMNIKNLNR